MATRVSAKSPQKDILKILSSFSQQLQMEVGNGIKLISGTTVK